MAGQATQIAEAVKDSLNATTFGKAFSAARLFLPLFDFSVMDDLHVTVASKSIEAEILGRSSATSEKHLVDVAVQQRLAGDPAKESTNDSELDDLCELVEDIADHFRQAGTLPGFASATYAGHAIEPLYSPQHLKEQKMFTSVITFTYSVQRA